MTKLGIQSALALLVVLTTSWNVVGQQISILQRTQSILAPDSKGQNQQNLTLPNVRFHRSASTTPAAPRQRREITDQMRSLLLAPPAHLSNRSGNQTENRVSYAHAYSTETQPGPTTSFNLSDSPVVNAGAISAGGGARYGFNPYSQSNPGAVRQVGGDDDARRSWLPPRQSETNATNSFSQISTSDFAELGNAIPLDAVQDPELPGEQQEENPQDPTDTQPRSLPDDLRPPTELPIPPIDQNPSDQNPSNQDPKVEPVDPPNLNGGEGAVVYPDRALPGRQSYPGPTAKHRRPHVERIPVPTNPRQTLYPPKKPREDSNPNLYPPAQQVYPPVQPFYPESVETHPVVPHKQYINPAIYPPSASVGNYHPVVPTHDSSCAEDCCKPSGWRLPLAIGENPPAIQMDSCCQPLFYVSVFGGISNAGNLEGGLPAVGATAGTFNLDDGANFGLVFGQYQGRNLRTEFEYAFRHNDVESIGLTENTGAGFNLTSFGLAGDIKAHSGMTNLVWEFSNPIGRFVKPYVGGGVGFVFMDVNATRGGQNVLLTGQDGNSSFAYQWFAGLNTKLSNEMDLFVEYRYFYADDLRLQTNLANVNGTIGTLSSSFDYNTSNVNFGLRFKF